MKNWYIKFAAAIVVLNSKHYLCQQDSLSSIKSVWVIKGGNATISSIKFKYFS